MYKLLIASKHDDFILICVRMFLAFLFITYKYVTLFFLKKEFFKKKFFFWIKVNLAQNCEKSLIIYAVILYRIKNVITFNLMTKKIGFRKRNTPRVLCELKRS